MLSRIARATAQYDHFPRLWHSVRLRRRWWRRCRGWCDLFESESP